MCVYIDIRWTAAAYTSPRITHISVVPSPTMHQCRLLLSLRQAPDHGQNVQNEQFNLKIVSNVIDEMCISLNM